MNYLYYKKVDFDLYMTLRPTLPTIAFWDAIIASLIGKFKIPPQQKSVA